VVKITLKYIKNNLTVYPNPVIDVATINVTTAQNTTFKLTLFDNRGRITRRKQISLLAGSNSFYVDMTSLAKGIYIALMVWGTETKKITIMKE